MTDRDEVRMRKALQGKDFPAERDDLVVYVTDRGEVDASVLAALAELPPGRYESVDDVTAAVPQRPRG